MVRSLEEVVHTLVEGPGLEVVHTLVEGPALEVVHTLEVVDILVVLVVVGRTYSNGYNTIITIN